MKSKGMAILGTYIAREPDYSALDEHVSDRFANGFQSK
jgi:hypothetical protein